MCLLEPGEVGGRLRQLLRQVLLSLAACRKEPDAIRGGKAGR